MVPRLGVVKVQRTSTLSKLCLKLFKNPSLLTGALYFFLHQHFTGELPVNGTSICPSIAVCSTYYTTLDKEFQYIIEYLHGSCKDTWKIQSSPYADIW